jgi:hypothetical protein
LDIPRKKPTPLNLHLLIIKIKVKLIFIGEGIGVSTQSQTYNLKAIITTLLYKMFMLMINQKDGI